MAPRLALQPAPAQDPAPAPSPVRDAFVARARAALDLLLREADDAQLARALAAPTDVGAVARALGDLRHGAVGALDPLAPAIARQVVHREVLLDRARPVVSADEAGRLLGVTRQAVDKRRRAGRLLALRLGGDWAYPAFQFEDGDVLPGLPEVVGRMAEAGPWATLDLLLAPDEALGGRSLLDALRGRDAEAAARVLRQQEALGFA